MAEFRQAAEEGPSKKLRKLVNHYPPLGQTDPQAPPLPVPVDQPGSKPNALTGQGRGLWPTPQLRNSAAGPAELRSCGVGTRSVLIFGEPPPPGGG